MKKQNSSIAFHPTNNKIVNFMINMVKHEGKVLDAGFGKGAFLDVLTTKPFTEIVGIEYSKEFYEEAYYLNAKLINTNYLTYFSKKKFDLIIGNPPYMKCSSLDKEMQQIVESIAKTRASDIYYAFIIKSIQLLKEEGTLLFILPKSFFVNKYAKYLRKYMLSHGYFEEIIDFGELNVFETANVETIIFKYRKTKNKKNIKIKIFSTTSREKFNKVFKDLEKSYEYSKCFGVFDFYTIEQFNINDSYWVISKRENLQFKTKKLGEYAEIGVGFVSGCEEVFKLNEETLDTFNNKEKKKFVFKFLKAKNIDNYIVNKNNSYMLFFDDSIKSEEDLFIFPNILYYIRKHKDKLENRYFSNKNKPYFSWLAIRNKNKIEENINNPIIIVPSLTRKKGQWFNISFDKKKYISSDILYIIPKDNISIYFLLGFLNSDFFFKEYNKKGMKKGERFVFNQGFLTNFEIPLFSEDVQIHISKLTEELVIGIHKRKWSKNRISNKRNEIEEIIKKNIKNNDNSRVFGQLSFVF